MSAAGRSRSAAIALLMGVVVLVGAAAVVPAAQSWTKQGGIIKNERLKMLRAAERNRAAESLAVSQAAWRSYTQDRQSGFILTDSNEDAVAETRDRIERVFASLGGKASAVATETESASREGVFKIVVEVRGSIPRIKLAALLANLESDPPYLFINTFESIKSSGDMLTVGIGGTILRLDEAQS